MQYDMWWRRTMTALVAILLAWNGWQEWSIHQVPERVEAAGAAMRAEADRIERARDDMLRTAERLEELTARLEQINVSVTAEGGHSIVYVRVPLTEEEIEHTENLMRLRAVWIANYGKDVADAVLYDSRTGRETAGAGPDSSGP